MLGRAKRIFNSSYPPGVPALFASKMCSTPSFSLQGFARQNIGRKLGLGTSKTDHFLATVMDHRKNLRQAAVCWLESRQEKRSSVLF
jgi:hypothetical protein